MKLFGQNLGNPNCPYMKRWVVDLGLFSFRLHHWRRSETESHMHCHPWFFITFVLAGQYKDVTPDGEETLSSGAIAYRSAKHVHTVRTNGCWTLLFCGPAYRTWGFYTKTKTGFDKWIKATRYFRQNPWHPCQS